MQTTADKLAALPGHRRTRPDARTVEIPAETVALCAARWLEYQAARVVNLPRPIHYAVIVPGDANCNMFLDHWGDVVEWPQAARVGYQVAKRLADQHGNGARPVPIENF